MRLLEVSEVPQARPLIRGPLNKNAWARCVYTMYMSMAGSDGWSRGEFLMVNPRLQKIVVHW